MASMQIQCPACAAVYDVPVILLTTARTMRCAVCAHDWTTTAVDPAIAQAELLVEPRAGSVAPTTQDHTLPAAIAELDRPDFAASRGGESAANPTAATAPLLEAARPGWHGRVATLLHAHAMALLAWAASLGGLALGGSAALAHRADIAVIWPPSRRLFLWLGMS